MEGRGTIVLPKKPSNGAGSRAGKKSKCKTASDRKRRPMKLETLRCWPEVVKRVKAGITCDAIAEWIQDNQLEYLEATRAAVTRALFRFKASLPPAEIEPDVPLYVHKAIEKLKRGIKEIEELEKLYLLQLGRISIDAQTESKINKLFSGTGQEIRLAMDLLDKRARLMMEMGLVKRAPLNMNLNGEISASFVPESMPDMPEDRALRLGVAAEKLLSVMLRASDKELTEAVVKGNEVVN